MYPGPAVHDLRNMGFIVLGMPGNKEYQSTVLPNGMSVLGLPYVKNLDRWCFNCTEDEVSTLLNSLPKHDVVVSHSPLKGILDKEIRGEYTGFDAYKEYCNTHSPLYWIHGHVHERYGSVMYGNTNVFNVSMSNREKQHVHPCVILDI